MPQVVDVGMSGLDAQGSNIDCSIWVGSKPPDKCRGSENVPRVNVDLIGTLVLVEARCDGTRSARSKSINSMSAIGPLG